MFIPLNPYPEVPKPEGTTSLIVLHEDGQVLAGLSNAPFFNWEDGSIIGWQIQGFQSKAEIKAETDAILAKQTRLIRDLLAQAYKLDKMDKSAWTRRERNELDAAILAAEDFLGI